MDMWKIDSKWKDFKFIILKSILWNEPILEYLAV